MSKCEQYLMFVKDSNVRIDGLLYTCCKASKKTAFFVLDESQGPPCAFKEISNNPLSYLNVTSIKIEFDPREVK